MCRTVLSDALLSSICALVIDCCDAMPPRPEGTDGSDFSYRQIIKDQYKQTAQWRALGTKLFYLTAIPVVVTLAWHLIPLLSGRPVWLSTFTMAGLYMIALLTFLQAKPASPKENFGLIKTANLLLLAMIGVDVVALYKYWRMTPEQEMLPHLLHSFLSEQKGWTDGALLSTYAVLEAVLEVATFALASASAFALHSYISIKMEMNKKLNPQSASEAAAVPSATKALPTPSPNKKRR